MDYSNDILVDKTFLGVEAFEFSADAVAQAQAYIAEMKAMTEGRRGHINTYRYWAVEKNDVWRELCDIALYWISIPTSSVSMERAFARTVAEDAPHRAGLNVERDDNKGAEDARQPRRA